MFGIVGFSYRTTGIQTTPIDEAPTVVVTGWDGKRLRYTSKYLLKKIVFVEKKDSL
jgi:hypothetical protein